MPFFFFDTFTEASSICASFFAAFPFFGEPTPFARGDAAAAERGDAAAAETGDAAARKGDAASAEAGET